MPIVNIGQPFDLRRRGQKDGERHIKKVKEAIKKNLSKIIAEEQIITTDGKKVIRVPIRYLDSYHFKFGQPSDGVGHGDGKEGDVLRPGNKDGDGSKAGNKPGDDVYDTEITIEELTDMMLDDLGLPWLDDKKKKEVITTHTTFTDIRKKGIMANWAKRKTAIENIKRNAREGKPAKFGNLTDDDMRFRTWDDVTERHSNAVVYLMMDRSGSMDETKRYLCKAVFWWICRFLEKKYDNVEVVFIAHDTDAKVVPEKDFFQISGSGGTMCSSAIELCLKDVQESRPSDIWNVYAFHFSDGDNFDTDNERCVKLLDELLPRVNMFAYGEVIPVDEDDEDDDPDDDDTEPRPDSLMAYYDKIEHPRMVTTVIRRKADVMKTLRRFLRNDMNLEEEEAK